MKQRNTRHYIAVIVGLIPSILFLAFIYFMMIKTFTGTVKETVSETELSFSSFETLSDSFEELLENNFSNKDDYINLNGLVTRTLGINTLNERYKLANGDLAREERAYDTTKFSDSVIELNDFLSEREIDFLYVLVPSKEAFYGTTFSPGYSSTAKEKIETMVDALTESNVNILNMDSWYQENNWTVDDVFYRTDHHWKVQAGLAAARTTMEILSERDLATFIPTTLDDDSWSVTVYKDWFLGSHGQRTGIPYAGVDDLYLYLPNFATNYSYSYLKHGETTWVYTDTILDLSYLDDIDYYREDSPYNMYMAQDPPNRITINTEATNDERILLMGDSFKQPYEYFLTTQFQEVYTVDLRYCTDGASFVQYVQEFEPDIVIMCSNTYSIADTIYTFGTSEYLTALEKTNPNAEAIDLGTFTIESDESSQSAFTIIDTDLSPGQAYTLTVDSIDYSGNTDRFIQITLQDLSANQAVVNRYFEIDSEKTQKWIFEVPEESHTYAIYLYAGTKGNTAGCKAKISGVKLMEGINEN